MPRRTGPSGEASAVARVVDRLQHAQGEAGRILRVRKRDRLPVDVGTSLCAILGHDLPASMRPCLHRSPDRERTPWTSRPGQVSP